MSLQMKPESTPTRMIREPSEPQSTHHDREADRVWPRPDHVAGSGWTLDIPVSRSPVEEALLNVVMTFGGNIVRMDAVDIDVSTEGRTAPEAYGRLVEAVSAYLEASGDERTELLRYTPDTWFRFVPPEQARYQHRERLQTEPQENPGDTERNTLQEFYAVPDLDALAEAQGIAPIEDIDELVADFWPEDETVEEFAATVRRWRDEGDRRRC